jgi:hypothetical protein
MKIERIKYHIGVILSNNWSICESLNCHIGPMAVQVSYLRKLPQYFGNSISQLDTRLIAIIDNNNMELCRDN